MESNFKKTLREVSSNIEIENTPAPVYDCQHCNDTGLRKAQPGDRVVLGSTVRYADGRRPETIEVMVREVNGIIYPDVSIDCEYCRPVRIRKQREKMQQISMMTSEESTYRMKNIILRPDRPGTTAMKQAVEEMLNDKAHMLLIQGTNGNAKSLALFILVNEFLDRGIPAIYVTASDMLNWISDAFNSDRQPKETATSTLDRIDMFKNVILLCIDELGAVKMTDWRAEIVDNIIDWRYRRALDGSAYTAMAMNEAVGDLSSRIRSRLKDKRLRDNGQHAVIVNNDPDARGKMRK